MTRAVGFIDNENRTFEEAGAETAEFAFGERLELQTPLPADAVRLRILSVRWHERPRRGNGPFREPWEFGYLMADPAAVGP